MLAFKGIWERTAPLPRVPLGSGGQGMDRDGQGASGRLGSQWPACEAPQGQRSHELLCLGPSTWGLASVPRASCGSYPSYGPVPGGGGHHLSALHAPLGDVDLTWPITLRAFPSQTSGRPLLPRGPGPHTLTRRLLCADADRVLPIR